LIVNTVSSTGAKR